MASHQRRASADHIAQVLQRERELAPVLFGEHSAAEIREAEATLRALDAQREATRRAAASPQIPLALDAAQ